MNVAIQMTPRPAATLPCRLSTIRDSGTAADRRRLERELHAAVTAGAFVLHYQPRVSLATGRIEANEALIRWPHRQRGLMAPGRFIPVAEQSGLIDRIGAWTLVEACTEAARWGGSRLAVNVSVRQLQSGLLPVQLAMALERSGLRPERLELELAEPRLAGSGIDTLLALSAIRDLGVGLTLDEFGTGFASLSMLKRLPLTVLKLDRCLVRGLPADREDAAIVRAAVATGHAIGLTVVADGIETEAQRAFLAGIGCDAGQGGLFSHPLPAEQLRRKLGLAHS